MDADILNKYKELESKVLAYNPSLNRDRLYSAFEYADKCHTGQLRKDGSPFITHPIAAAVNAADMGLDEDSIIAALLHDCIEDTEATYDEIQRRFGGDVANIVDGVSKLTHVQYTTKEQEQMENLRKMLMAMAKDIRVILVKLADRMHNMRTMDYQSPEKQREKARETMEVYAPIAHRLGMQRVKWELEDRSLRYLDPEGYKKISDTLSSGREEQEDFISSMKGLIEARLESAHGIKATVYGRVKHIYSIYRKMYLQHKELEEVFDLYALRVVVDSLQDCYTVLGCIHELFRPVPGHFKDYICNPKPNGYQSLHTTVFGYQNGNIVPFEVQIRTWDMHHTAEYGVAAHWKYKQGISAVGDEEKYAWVRQLLETQQDSDSQGFFSDLKVDMFSDEVFVFTPRGDVVNLPAGATPIDFAYNIHSAVGNSMTGAKINGRIVTFDRVLQNGDIVDILTSPASRGPSRDWLNIAKSAQARTKIRQWFKRERREENVAHGKSSLESELKRLNIPLSVLTDESLMSSVLKKTSFTGVTELLAAIGYGGYTSIRAANRIRDELQALEKKSEKLNVLPLGNLPEAVEARPVKAISGVIVSGLDNCLVRFSRCCTPVPGDDIVGFITRGAGVSIHRSDCKNYHISEDGTNRWVKVRWSDDVTDTYQAGVVLIAHDRANLHLDITTAISTTKLNIRSINMHTNRDGTVVHNMIFDVKNIFQLQEVMTKLKNVRSVINVERSHS